MTVTPYEDGPLLVRGPFELVTQDGEAITPGRETVALCRCGLSAQKPFCDGSHKTAGFRAPSGPRTTGSAHPPADARPPTVRKPAAG
ncbi:CDGSH iron-sulfur domain-containing protein [Nonomuraea sp. CA-218870]|uniref:CDGSH iron-sulfur domain-containing protein n=1 Tax=Nonomuraea sp. CA-218870 TaxID=3239998 RepID=UPI003D8DFD9F